MIYANIKIKMFSLLKIRRITLERINILVFLLPLLALSVTFSSKPVYPDILLHQIFSSAFIVCSMVVFYRWCRYEMLAVGIPVAVVVLRIIRYGYGDASGILEIIYFVPYSILMLGVGAKMLRDYPLLLLRQIVWISIVSAFLSLLQIVGVQWAQELANYYMESGGSSYDYLFVNWADLPPASNVQMRPVGFAQANNVLSQYLLFFYAFTIMCYMNNRHRFRPPLMWLFIVSFACALTGAKVVLAGIILLNIATIVFVANKKQVIRVFLLTSFSYFCYWMLFPGLFIYNFNIDLFSFNAMLRLTTLLNQSDIILFEDIISFLSQYMTGEYIGQRSVERTVERAGDTINIGIGTIINYLPIILLIGLMLAPIWISKLRKLVSTFLVNYQKLPIIMIVAIVASTAGGPFVFTSYFWFFFSFALYPLSVLLLKSAHNRIPSSKLV